MPSPVSSPVSSLGSQSARKATPRRSPRPRKVTASGPQQPSSDSSDDDDDDDEEVRRLEAALAAAKAKKKRRREAAVQPPRKRRARQSEAEECGDAWECFANERLPKMEMSELKKLLKTLKLFAKDAYRAAMAARESKDEAAARKVVRALFEHIPRDAILGAYVAATERSLPPLPAPKSARTAASGYDTLDDAAAAKQLSSLTASAARRALTRGRWRPFKAFCLDGDGRGCEVIALQSYTDQDRALFREVWALEPGAVIDELTLWPPMPSTSPNYPEIEGALRFLEIVEPEATRGFGRIVAAFAASGGLARPPNSVLHWRPGRWARAILCQWRRRVDGDLLAGLEQGNIDLGLGAWETPTDGAKFILRHVATFVFRSHAEFMGSVELWQDRSAAEIFVEAYEEMAEELEEMAEREAYYVWEEEHIFEDSYTPSILPV